jgi:hypothetical protein
MLQLEPDVASGMKTRWPAFGPGQRQLAGSVRSMTARPDARQNTMNTMNTQKVMIGEKIIVMLKVPYRHFLRFAMTGFELKLWRRGFGWDQLRAAEELDIGLRTYKRYETSPKIPLLLELAIEGLSLRKRK